MALQKSEQRGQVTMPEAYHRIELLQYNRGHIMGQVCVYADKESADNGDAPIRDYDPGFTMDEFTKANLGFKKGYENLKKRAEHTNSVSV